MLVIACGILIMRFRQAEEAKQTASLSQTARLTAQLQKSMLLPAEQPALVTVLDRTKLGDRDLVREARNGDSLLIFSQAKRVVLYRPSLHKVVDMFHVEDAPGHNAVTK